MKILLLWFNGVFQGYYGYGACVVQERDKAHIFRVSNPDFQEAINNSSIGGWSVTCENATDDPLLQRGWHIYGYEKGDLRIRWSQSLEEWQLMDKDTKYRYGSFKSPTNAANSVE